MASEKAKELAAKQKAELKAAKLRKKTSNNPRDWGAFRQVKETLTSTVKVDPASAWWLIGSFLLAAVLISLVGIWAQPWWVWLITGVAGGLAAAMWMLILRAKKAAYIRHKGQPGAAEVAFGLLNKKQWTTSLAITATKQLDIVHRAVGPAGIVLVGEGSAPRLRSIMASEVKKHEQVAYGVPVTSVIMGDGEGQVPLEKLEAHLKKMPKAIDKLQIAEVNQRLKALDAVRPRVPVPRGPLVMPKGAMKAMRGR